VIVRSLKILSVAVAYASDIFDVRNSENAKRKKRQTTPAVIFLIIEVICRLLHRCPLLADLGRSKQHNKLYDQQSQGPRETGAAVIYVLCTSAVTPQHRPVATLHVVAPFILD